MIRRRSTFIVIKTAIAAMHSWPDAPEEYSYLRPLHRHLFTIEITADTPHGNRAIEINEVKQQLDRYLYSELSLTSPYTGLPSFGSSSCEQIASTIATWFADTYKTPAVFVKVLEDGHLGGGCALETLSKRK